MKRTTFRKTALAAALGIAAVVGVAAIADAHGGGGWGGFGMGGGMMGGYGGYGPGMMGGYGPGPKYAPQQRGYGPDGSPNPAYARTPRGTQAPAPERDQ